MTPIESPHPYLLLEGNSEQNYLFPDEVIDCRFEEITPESLRSMAEKTMGRCDEIFEQILNCEDLTYDKILRPLSEIDDQLQQLFNFLSMSILLHPEQDVRQAAAETSMTVLRASNGYLYSFDVDKKILAYSRTQQAKELEGEEEHYLDSSLQQRISAGHGLPRAQRKKVRKLQTSLFELEIDFLSNIAEDQTTVILDSSEIVGLDEQDKKSYLIDLGEDRYALDMNGGANLGFLRLAVNRQARQKAYLAYNSRLRDANGLVLQKAVDFRQRVAWLLGYESWLHFTYEYNMAESPEVIFDMYKEVIGPISAKAKNELAEMEQMLDADGHSGPLQVYDWEYYENKLLNEKYGIKLDKVREYFPLPAVLDGVFDLTGEMFGLTYRPIDVATWHPDVLAFAVDDRQSGQQIGEIYMDLFSREGKYKHCCTQSLVSGRALPDGTYRQPSSLIIANLTRPIDGEPALLSQRQRIDIAFHEFGHALHDVLTKSKLAPFAGLATEVDFVEIPSQLMENWAWDKELLAKQARHYQTGEPMPEDTINALIGSQDVNAGIKYLRDISLALFDLSLNNSLDPIDIPAQWEQAVAISPFPLVDGTFYPAIFEHLVSDYGGNYYSYFYDEIFSFDIFARFEQEGLTKPNVGTDYRQKILEPGSSRKGTEMIKNFLGREPNNQAFLRSLGIVAIAES